MGDCVRKANGGPKLYDSWLELVKKKSKGQFAILGHVCEDKTIPWVLGEHLPECLAMLAVEFPKQSNKSYKEPQEADGRGNMALCMFGSSLFGM